MSSLLGIPTINLPPTISSSSVINDTSSSSSYSSPILILISKDMSVEDLDTLKEFGTVLVWKDSFINVAFSSLNKSDYLVIDVRNKNARIALGKENLKEFDIVHYVTWIQKTDEYLSQVEGNTITSFPRHCVTKSDFDNALLRPKIVAPSLIKSFFLLLVGCFKK